MREGGEEGGREGVDEEGGRDGVGYGVEQASERALENEGDGVLARARKVEQERKRTAGADGALELLHTISNYCIRYRAIILSPL